MKDAPDRSTRKLLLTMLKTSGALGVADMARRLGVTEMAVRRHLSGLERDGLVSITLVRQTMGRPSYLYSLTADAEQHFPKNYHGLALDLLDELVSGGEDDIVGRLFDRRREKFLRRYSQQLNADDLPGKVGELAEIQNGSGYMAVWGKDQESGDYVIDEFNCPISQIADRYNQACESELELFRQLLGADVERVECLAKNGMKCRYRIRERSN